MFNPKCFQMFCFASVFYQHIIYFQLSCLRWYYIPEGTIRIGQERSKGEFETQKGFCGTDSTISQHFHIRVTHRFNRIRLFLFSTQTAKKFGAANPGRRSRIRAPSRHQFPLIKFRPLEKPLETQHLQSHRRLRLPSPPYLVPDEP